MPTAIAGFDRLGAVSGTVVVQGAGPVGLAAVVLAAEAGAERILVFGDPPPRLHMAARLGATQTFSLSSMTRAERLDGLLQLNDGRGADIVIEAAGHISAFDEGLELLGNNGRLLIMGLYSGEATVRVNPVHINNRNLRIIGTLGSPASAYARTVQLAAEIGERLGFADLVTHRYPLELAEEAIIAAGRGEVIKAVVCPGL